MGFLRFRKTLTKKGSPISINLSKHGPSISIGKRKGGKLTLGKGRHYFTFGLPGTGLSYTIGKRRSKTFKEHLEEHKVFSFAHKSEVEVKTHCQKCGHEGEETEFVKGACPSCGRHGTLYQKTKTE